MKRILYVEDEDQLQDIFCDALDESFFSVDSAFNDLEAIELLKAKVYDYLIIDLKYENGRNAVELFKYLNDVGSYQDQKVFIVSGYVDSKQEVIKRLKMAVKCSRVYLKPEGFFRAIDDLEELACPRF